MVLDVMVTEVMVTEVMVAEPGTSVNHSVRDALNVKRTLQDSRRGSLTCQEGRGGGRPVTTCHESHELQQPRESRESRRQR